MLLHDVGEHTVASWELEARDDLFEQAFEPDDGVELVGRGVEPDDHVAAAVGETFENGQQNLAFIVTRAVGLDARAKVLGAADDDCRRGRAG